MGSEMCIRDRSAGAHGAHTNFPPVANGTHEMSGQDTPAPLVNTGNRRGPLSTCFPGRLNSNTRCDSQSFYQFAQSINLFKGKFLTYVV